MLGKVIGVILIIVGSAFKYSWATLIAAESNWGLIPSFIFNFGGGFIGVHVFTYLGEHLRDYYNNRLKNKNAYFIHTRRNRLLVHIRKRLGLKGVAILSPILLTLPLGTAILLTMTKDHGKIIRYMLVSCLFWTALILIPYKLFHVDLSKMFMDYITGLYHAYFS